MSKIYRTRTSRSRRHALVNRLMRRSRARRVVLLLDCCYGGAFERGVIARLGGTVDVGNQFAMDALGGGRGRAVITASSAMEYAFEGSALTDGVARPSVFTAALVEGLTTGEADRDNDGYVSLGELYDYVYDRVRERSPRQTPCKWEFDLQGDFYLARNPRRRIVPGRLPPDLVELVVHPHVEVRVTAVQLLEQAARGNDLPRAAAARLALAELADEDSRRVSSVANAALQQTALRLSVPSVDLGQVLLGKSARSSETELQGTLLALGSTMLTVAGPVTARLDGSTVSISWTPEEPGRMDATVTVSGLTGEVRLPVTGQAVAPPSAPPAVRPSEPKHVGRLPIRPAPGQSWSGSSGGRVPTAARQSPSTTRAIRRATIAAAAAVSIGAAIVITLVVNGGMDKSSYSSSPPPASGTSELYRPPLAPEFALPTVAPNGVTTNDQVFGAACHILPQGNAPGSLNNMGPQPVASAASTNPLLTTLVTAVKAANLVDTLNQAKGITVYAPYNGAFDAVKTAMGDQKFNALLADPTALGNVLKYHVVGTRYDAAGLVKAGQTTELYGGTVKVGGTATAPTLTDGKGNTATVLCGNIPTSNATVFVIDKVLMSAS